MRGIGAVAVPFERVMRRIERLHRPVEVARDERDLGLGDGAPCAGDGLPRAESAGRAPQQCFGAAEIAELCHRDAAKRQRRRIVAQGDVVQRAERITRRERARGGGDQRVHSNPDTLVTPGRPVAGGKSISRSTPAKPPQKRGWRARATKGERR